MAEYKDVELLKKQIADFKRAVNAVKPMNSDYLTGYISALSAVEGAIAEQPTADVVPVRHGCWRIIETLCGGGKEAKYYRCSECNKANVICSNYCPNCGARMDGDADANGNDNKTPET